MKSLKSKVVIHYTNNKLGSLLQYIGFTLQLQFINHAINYQFYNFLVTLFPLTRYFQLISFISSKISEYMLF